MCFPKIFGESGEIDWTVFGFRDIIGSFRSADVRLCVSCANFGSWHSYKLETLRTLESSTVIAEKSQGRPRSPTQLKD